MPSENTGTEIEIKIERGRTFENFKELGGAVAVAEAAEEEEGSLPLSYSANKISTSRSPLQ